MYICTIFHVHESCKGNNVTKSSYSVPTTEERNMFTYNTWRRTPELTVHYYLRFYRHTNVPSFLQSQLELPRKHKSRMRCTHINSHAKTRPQMDWLKLQITDIDAFM